jgi:hypothetical protein
MLRISRENVQCLGGILPALSEASAEFVSSMLVPRSDDGAIPAPEKLILHKEPHLDEYAAAFFYRCAQDRSLRSVPFVERSLHWDHDNTAELEWPRSAVFGIGVGRSIASRAGELFDEHLPEGGRKEDSCTDIVFDRKLEAWDEAIDRLKSEISKIDTSGGAHALHLANILKSIHVTPFGFGKGSTGTMSSGKIVAAWKRAIVESLLAAILYCEKNAIAFSKKDVAKPCIDIIFERLKSLAIFNENVQCLQTLQNLRKNCEPGWFEANAKVEIDGAQRPQILVLPSLIAAAFYAWGEEICVFLISHLIEAVVKSNLVYQTGLSLVRECWDNPKFPKQISKGGISLRIVTTRGARASGVQKANPWDRNFNRNFTPKPILISIIHCKYTDANPQPHKGLMAFVTQDLHGTGLLLLEHVKDSRKAIFKGAAITKEQWMALVSRLQSFEPGLWYLVNENASFLLNGNAAHPIPMSSVDARGLARLLDEGVLRNDGS